jgi:hypothetical protein
MMDMSQVLYECYAAGYENRPFPIDLRRVGNSEDRQTARKAFADGVHWQRRDKIFLRRMCGRR